MMTQQNGAKEKVKMCTNMEKCFSAFSARPHVNLIHFFSKPILDFWIFFFLDFWPRYIEHYITLVCRFYFILDVYS